MEHQYKTKGVCASKIAFELENGMLRNVRFTDGCNGNLKAISKLVEGKDAREVAEILRGNTCGGKKTSCADQLATAICQALNEDG